MRVPLVVSLSVFASLAFVATIASPQQQHHQKYPWQHGDTNCNDTMTFAGTESKMYPTRKSQLTAIDGAVRTRKRSRLSGLLKCAA